MDHICPDRIFAPFLASFKRLLFSVEKIIHLLTNNIHCHYKQKVVFLHKKKHSLNENKNIITKRLIYS